MTVTNTQIGGATATPTATIESEKAVPVETIPPSDITLQVLSSGITVSDIVDGAMPSVVQVVTNSSRGTGFAVGGGARIVTNNHVVLDADRVGIILHDGREEIADVAERDSELDIAYVEADSMLNPPPVIAMGNSDTVRLGEQVVIIGFPLDGSAPTVSTGIVSAIRDGYIQTDASMNPGNSGGPMLDSQGRVIGIVVAQVVEDSSGNAVSGIGFAIPANLIRGDSQPALVSTPTVFPTIEPPPNIVATREAIEAADEFRRRVAEATQTAVEAREEARRYAMELEATRIAELPTRTPEPTRTPLPTATPHPATHCDEWESMILDWVREGHSFYERWGEAVTDEDPPEMETLSTKDAIAFCNTEFPIGRVYVMGNWDSVPIGTGREELLPGTYRYRWEGGTNVEGGCKVITNYSRGFDGYAPEDVTELPFDGEFTITLYEYHISMTFVPSGSWGRRLCSGALVRVGD